MTAKVGERFQSLLIPEPVAKAAAVSLTRILTPNQTQVELR